MQALLKQNGIDLSQINSIDPPPFRFAAFVWKTPFNSFWREARRLRWEHNYERPQFLERTALPSTCQFRRIHVVTFCIHWKMNPRVGRDSCTGPIIAASKRNWADFLEVWLSAPSIHINVRGVRGLSTPLMNAANLVSYKATELLLVQGRRRRQSARSRGQYSSLTDGAKRRQ